MRWRFRRWGNSWQRFRRRGEQTVAHVRYEHKTCPECTAVNDRGARTCASCGHRLPSRRWQLLERIGMTTPKVVSMSGVLGLMCALVYVSLIAANGGGGIVSIPTHLLYERGANSTAAVAGGDWWRLATSVFLHAGLWHIGFNLLALASVGPEVEREYGGLVMVLLFMVTGVIAAFGSESIREVGVGIGASGAIMGLIGVLAARGHRAGTSYGRAMRNTMLRWTAMVMIFGLMIGADNWAHGIGFAAGAVFGFVVDPGWLKTGAAQRVALIAGAVALLAAGATTYAALRPPPSVYAQRLADDLRIELDAQITPWVERCRDPLAADAPDCQQLEDQRRRCSHGLDSFVPRDIMPEGRAYFAVLCELIGHPDADR